jgi:hypothetical protein
MVEENLMPQVSKDMASQIAVEYIKFRKETEKINVADVEDNGDGWVVRGTCPIDLEGHQWAEKFEVLVDFKGKVRTSDFALL